MHASFSLLSVALLSLTPLVAAHCKITSAKGNLGGAGVALGITANDGNSESDVTVFQGGSLGKTPGGGAIVLDTAFTAALKLGGNTLPQVSQGGVVTMNLHQVNGDGAGPFTCSVDASGTGNSFVAMEVTTNVAGTNGASGAADADFPLVASLPANVVCKGTIDGVSNVCLVQCHNPAGAGPFGGTVPVQMKVSGGGGSDTTTTSSTTSTTTTADSTTTSSTTTTTSASSTTTTKATLPPCSKFTTSVKSTATTTVDSGYKHDGHGYKNNGHGSEHKGHGSGYKHHSGGYKKHGGGSEYHNDGSNGGSNKYGSNTSTVPCDPTKARRDLDGVQRRAEAAEERAAAAEKRAAIAEARAAAAEERAYAAETMAEAE